MCCALNRAPRADFRGLLDAVIQLPDVGLSNGLCQSIIADAQGNQKTQFSRDSCTRSDWVGCLKNVCSRVSGVSFFFSYVKFVPSGGEGKKNGEGRKLSPMP